MTQMIDIEPTKRFALLLLITAAMCQISYRVCFAHGVKHVHRMALAVPLTEAEMQTLLRD